MYSSTFIVRDSSTSKSSYHYDKIRFRLILYKEFVCYTYNTRDNNRNSTMKDVFEKLNWAFLLSHKVYGGPPPTSYRKAWYSLFTVNLKLHDRISDILEAKLDAVLKAMRDSNGYNDLATVNSLHDFINAVMIRSGNQIPQADADIVIAAAQELIRPLRRPAAEQATQLLNSKREEEYRQSIIKAIFER